MRLHSKLYVCGQHVMTKVKVYTLRVYAFWYIADSGPPLILWQKGTCVLLLNHMWMLGTKAGQVTPVCILGSDSLICVSGILGD